jgi:hypothetical protein
MSRAVEITFDCLPLRSLGRFDIPIDASPEQRALGERIRRAVEKHGVHNVYYLCNARCVFRLTNHEQIGMIEFAFEGSVLTDAADQKTLHCDLTVALHREVCPWLTAPAVEWLGETVVEAVRIEFDRYIAAGDLEKTIRRMEQIQAASDARGGFMGMGL